MVDDVLTDPPEAELTRVEELAVQLRGFAHPTKVAVARLLADGEKSPKMLSVALELPLGRVSYHVRGMAEVGLIRETRLEPVRGAAEHFYELTDVGREWLRRWG